MPSLSIPKGDYGIIYTFQVMQKVNDDIVPKDISGFTVMLKMWSAGTPGTLLLNQPCAIIDGPDGICIYTSSSGNFDTVGKYSAELELTAAGIVDSTMRFTISVEESG